LANPVLYFSPLIISIFILGCASEIGPTYKEEELFYQIKKILKDEYKLDVITKQTDNALWVYAPLSRLINKDYAKDKTKLLDEGMIDNLRNILITVGRVILSADKSPEFYCLVASDITEIGVDYTLIGYTLDIKKSYAGLIPWTETNRRYVIHIELNPQALSDTVGRHVWVYNITLEDFLAKQIAQRISGRFQDDELKNYFQVESATGRFNAGTFYFEYAIKEILPKDIDIKEEMLKIISYVIQTYEFEDFSMVELKDLTNQDTRVLSKARIKEFKLP
jgi:hypothetical protein